VSEDLAEAILRDSDANLPKITGRSRDNLRNPLAMEGNPYVPANSPAIDDLFGMFQFERGGDGDFDKDGKKG